MIKWFDTREAEATGEKLASFYSSRVPADIENDKKAIAKQVDAIKKTLIQTQALIQGTKLNFYQKAKLCNAFKQKLLAMRYGKEFVDEFTREIILILN